MILYTDGPEGAGKTWLVNAVAEAVRPHGWHVVHVRARRPIGADSAQLAAFYERAVNWAVDPQVLVCLDRAWASELVYNNLLDRPGNRFHNDETSAAEGYIPYLGLAVMVLSDAATLRARRHERGVGDDHPIDSDIERAAFQAYAVSYPDRWHVWYGDNAPGVVAYIVEHLETKNRTLAAGRRSTYGHPNALVDLGAAVASRAYVQRLRGGGA